jgi:hypothetical protein
MFCSVPNVEELSRQTRYAKKTVALLKVLDAVTAAYESQSEEETDEICETLVQSLAAYSQCVMAILLQVPDGVMAAHESQSKEEEMD